MSIITLTTDWGNNDYFKALIKGVFIAKLQSKELQVVEITHEIPSFDTTKAAFILMNCYHNFPVGSVHFVDVFSHSEHLETNIILERNQHFFIGSYSNVFSLMFPDKDYRIYRIITQTENNFDSFKRYELMIDATIHIFSGKDVLEIAEVYNDYLEEKFFFVPKMEGDTMIGRVIYIDKYGNAITNITKSFFESHIKGNRFEILSKLTRYKLNKISTYYNSVPKNEMLAFFNSLGYLELAINSESAQKLLGYNINDKISIKIL